MDELERLVRAHNVTGNQLRTNVQRGEATKVLPNGRTILEKPIESQSLRSGPIFDNVKKTFPWATDVAVNHNFASTKHRDGAHTAQSAIVLFGPFTGGALVVSEPKG